MGIEMIIEMKPSQAFDVIDKEGTLLVLNQIGEEWNHMIELQDSMGHKLIVSAVHNELSQMISNLLGSGKGKWKVISGSPELIERFLPLETDPD